MRPSPDAAESAVEQAARAKGEGVEIVAIGMGSADLNYLKRLANRANHEVELSINDTPSLEKARRVVVKTVSEDTRIRYADWVREDREYVDKKSNGQLGYIHLYDMSGRGLRQFARDYPPQWRKRQPM